MSSPLSGHSKRPALFVTWGAWLAVAGLVLARIPLILHRVFDPDELEHSHAAWCVFRGMLPYRDFFEHHTPWYYYALQPLFRIFDVAASFDGASHFLIAGRCLSLVLTVLSVGLLYRIGRLLSHGMLGLLAGLLLVGQPFFLEKTIEIRPDVLALPLFLGGLVLLLRALAADASSPRKALLYFCGSGIAVGAAVMCTQKMLFVLPGAFAGLALWGLAGVLRGKASTGGPPRPLLVLAFLAGVAAPAVATWAAFALQGAGRELITNNLLLNLRWKPIETHQLPRFFSTSRPILAAGAVGVTAALLRFFRLRQRRYEWPLLLFILLGLLAGAFAIPSAHAQYYLPLLPLICLFAAQGLLFVTDHAGRWGRVVLLALGLSALAILPAFALRDAFGMRNDGQLAMLRYVFETTRPDDVVMDGWQGTGVFRPHAFHYFFLHREILAVLPAPELAMHLFALERGNIRPKLIAMDGNLAALGPRFRAFVARNYATHDGFFYFRNGSWPGPGQGTRPVPPGAPSPLRGGFWQPSQGGLLHSVRGF